MNVNQEITELRAKLEQAMANSPKQRKDFEDTLAYIEYLLPLSKLDVRFNVLKSRLEINGEPADYTDLRREFVKEFGYGLPIVERGYVLSWYLQNKPYDPIKAYLDGLPEPKISPYEHIAKIFGFEPDSFDVKLILVNLLGAVYRGYEPGCKMQSVLVLIGKQGLFKSTLLLALMPDEDLFVEPKKQRNEVHELQVFHQHWFVNMSELDTMFSRKLQSEIKDFITSNKDVMVKPYAPEPKTYYRQFVLVGSTNEDELFRDSENRRFHCIKLSNKALDIQYAKENRDDLWAGLKKLYLASEQYWFEHGSPEDNLVRERNLQYREESPFTEKLNNYLEYYGKKPFKLEHCAEKVLDLLDCHNAKKLKQLKTELKALGYENKRVYTDGAQHRVWTK